MNITTKAPISLCLICRNDEKTLEACLQSIAPYVKEIVIVDTGSSDSSPEIAKKYATKFEVYTDCNDPETGLIENFAQARQRSFDLATQPWLIWVDADDLIVGGEHLARLVETCEKNRVGNQGFGILFKYEYSYDEQGKPTCVHYRERLLSAGKFKWQNAVHEVAVNIDNNVLLIQSDDVVYKHQRQYHSKQVETDRNLRILRKYVAGEGKDDIRQQYYLGLECFNNGLIDEAIEHFINYTNKSGWHDELNMAYLKLIDIYISRADYPNCLKYAFKIIETKEDWCEGYFALAKIYYLMAIQGGTNEQDNWKRCIHFSKIGLQLPPTQTVLFINPNEREVEIHRYLNIALNKLGKVQEALESVEVALKSKPNDASLLINKKIYQVFLAKKQTVDSLNILKSLGEFSELTYNEILNLLNKPPILSESSQSIENFDDEFDFVNSHDITQDDKLNIIFYAGQGMEDWNPETVKEKGIGGSELMMINMSKRLASLGHKIKVYNSCGKEGIYGDVEYLHYSKYQNLTCDILIISRRADILHSKFNIKARIKILWVHDIYALGASNELLLKADKILALSSWHKDTLSEIHNLHPDHIIQTRNGIELKRFNKKIKRDPFKCINSSSPDRSWPVLLDIWPRIKKEVPKASLHLYYGFLNWKMGAQNNPLQLDLIKRIENKIKELASLDVVYHDRVNQEELAKEYLSAGLILYPTFFAETSNIGGMEAQAAGLKVISSSIAALNETIGDRGVLIEGDWSTKEYQDKFVTETINALKNNKKIDRKLLKNYAKENFCLDKLALEWQSMFYNLIEEKKIKPLNPYQPTKSYRDGGNGYFEADKRFLVKR